MPFPSIVASLLISIALNVVAYALMPRPRSGKSESVQDLENPTAEAGKPLPVIFGEITIKDPNVLWYGDKMTKQSNR